ARDTLPSGQRHHPHSVAGSLVRHVDRSRPLRWPSHRRSHHAERHGVGVDRLRRQLARPGASLDSQCRPSERQGNRELDRARPEPPQGHRERRPSRGSSGRRFQPAEDHHPFPYEKLAHLESSTRFGGMENATAIFYADQPFRKRTMTDGVVAHETAHQWFGDAVTETEWSHLWLSEGFATYFAALWTRQSAGD